MSFHIAVWKLSSSYRVSWYSEEVQAHIVLVPKSATMPVILFVTVSW